MHMPTCLVALLASGAILTAAPAWGQPSAALQPLDVPYVPTPPEVVRVMLALAKVAPSDTVYDLGSGDGRLVVTAADRHGARGLGVEIDPQRVAEARVNARRAGVAGKVEFKQADLFGIDLRPATVLTMYLLPDVNLKLRPRILEQLRPGARVVSHDFDMAEWQPDARRTVGEHCVFLWIVPARVAGTWGWTVPLTSGPRQYAANLDQRFQQVEGTAVATTTGPSTVATGLDGKIPLTDAKLVGDQLAFTIRDPGGPDGRPLIMQYQGSVSNGTTTGVVTIVEGASSAQVPWNARLQSAR
jgi:hypothetical protein